MKPAATTQESEVQIAIAQGRLRGRGNAGVYSFKGIPYAGTLLGLDRWRPPQPAKPFSGVFDARDFGEISPQYVASVPGWILPKAGKALMELMKDAEAHPQGPDALNLNVWTPSVSAEARLPVMLFIHGGGLSSGSGRDPVFNGENLARKGMVVVTINYRLGMMGFLTGDGLFPGDVLVGNRGFMDCRAALEWVQQNIAAFGGDPTNVTVAGQSGGGTAVWALLASPSTEGLFRRAICMSGPINMVSVEDQKELTKDVLKKLKLPIGDVAALANLSDEQAKSAIVQTTLFSKLGTPYGEMSLTKLPATGAYGTPFLPEDVLVALKNGRAKQVELMVGSCDNDGRVAYVSLPFPSALGVRMMNYMVAGMIGPTKEARKDIVAKYAALMPGASSTLVNERVQTDGLYRIRALKAASIHARNRAGHTYVYQFNWQSPVADGALGALHGLDISFAFNNLERSTPITGDVNLGASLAEDMSEAFVSFARTGKPQGPGLPPWPTYDADTRRTMVFDNRSEIVSDPGGDQRELWD